MKSRAVRGHSIRHAVCTAARIAHELLGDAVVVDDPDDPKARLRRAVVRHLQRHPLAGDTPEGMVACWLPAHGYESAARYISEVVATMVAARELVAVHLPDGRVLYKRGPALSNE